MSVLKIILNLKNLRENYQVFTKLSQHNAAVVKADAYGLGAELIVNTLTQLGCRIFFVANADEGICLRKKFSDIQIYIFDGFLEKQKIMDYNLKPVLNTQEQLAEYVNLCPYIGATLHIDTGMNRLGIPLWEVSSIDKNILAQAKIDFLMSHYSESDTNSEFTQQQYQAMIQVSDYLGIKNISIANSCGRLLYQPNKNFLTRTGTAIYGGVDDPRIKPVVSLIGTILQKKTVPQNQPIGYGLAYITHRNTRLITVAGGYADGILRGISHQEFSGDISGYKLPLLGRVTMDSCMFDATDLPEDLYNQVTELEYYGERNSVFHMAKCANTISYEIFTQLSHRAERRIVDS